MIDIQRENVVSLTEAAKFDFLPKRRRGKRISPSTLYRWSKHGIRGVRLEVIRAGGTLCTSACALQRFFEQLSRVQSDEPRFDKCDGSIEAERRLSERGI